MGPTEALCAALWFQKPIVIHLALTRPQVPRPVCTEQPCSQVPRPVCTEQPCPQVPRPVCTALVGVLASHNTSPCVSRLFLHVKIRKPQPGMVAHVFNPRTQGAKAGGLLQVQDQPGLNSYTLH